MVNSNGNIPINRLIASSVKLKLDTNLTRDLELKMDYKLRDNLYILLYRAHEIEIWNDLDTAIGPF